MSETEEIEKLKSQINKMKKCSNCIHNIRNYPAIVNDHQIFIPCDQVHDFKVCEEWEFNEYASVNR